MAFGIWSFQPKPIPRSMRTEAAEFGLIGSDGERFMSTMVAGDLRPSKNKFFFCEVITVYARLRVSMMTSSQASKFPGNSTN